MLVGEDTFGAHRSLISARNPVFAAMFASGMKEAETGRVLIGDVDSTAFHRFLKFIYTEMLNFQAMDEKHFTVAHKYGVETLMELSRPANATEDTDGGLLQNFISNLNIFQCHYNVHDTQTVEVQSSFSITVYFQ